MKNLWIIACQLMLLLGFVAPQNFEISVSGALREKVKKLKRSPQVSWYKLIVFMLFCLKGFWV